jgi:hypothetical protein
MLTLSVVLGIVQIVAVSHAASLQRGYRWTASPRDEKVPPLRGVAGRLERALRNFLAGLERGGDRHSVVRRGPAVGMKRRQGPGRWCAHTNDADDDCGVSENSTTPGYSVNRGVRPPGSLRVLPPRR